MNTSRKVPHAFTLIELLVVIAVIAILLAILAPSLQRAKYLAQNTVCKTKLRNIGQAFTLFATEHQMRLPGGCYTKWQGPADWQKSWAGSEINWGNQPGTLLPYLGDKEAVVGKLYRCPSLEEAPLHSGTGSNGMFDYVCPLTFAGSRITTIPLQAEAFDPDGTENIQTFAPLLLEEDPMYYCNRTAIEPSHSYNDRPGLWHDNGSNLISADGSVHRIEFTGRAPNTFQWKMKTPSGKDANLQHTWTGYAEWEKR